MEIYIDLKKFIQKHNIDSHIGVAFSGGRDSTVLAHALSAVYEKEMITLLYVNHHLREDAQEEEQFVADWSSRNSNRYEKFDINLPSRSNLEEESRIRRYAIFKKWAHKNKAVIFTAHHRDDQVETILYRLFTGTGVNGLAAIEESNGIIFRPFLNISRGQIDQYQEKYDVNYYFDNSNSDNSFKRNALRNEIIPIIKNSFGESVDGNLVKFQNHFADYFRFRDEIFHYLKKNQLIKYRNQQIIVEKRLFFFYFPSFTKFMVESSIRDVFNENCIFNEKKWSDIIANISNDKAKIQIPFNLNFFITAERIWIQPGNIEETQVIDIQILPEGRIKWNDWDIKWLLTDRNDRLVFSPMDVSVDPDKFGEKIKIASPKKGEKIQKVNNRHFSQVQKILSDFKIPVPLRERIPVVYRDDSGEIIGGPYMGAAEQYKITSNTTKILTFHFKVKE